MHDAVPAPPLGAAPRTLADGRADLLIREEPLLLVVGGQQLLTMRTPGRDEDLALGFLLGEGIVARPGDVRSMQWVAGDPDARKTDELHVELVQAPGALARARLTRTHEIRSSCGVCGVADAATILDTLPPLLPGVPQLPRALVPRLLTQLAERQELFAATGGCHGALVATADGRVLGAAEDVGRHNALDKAIGEAARQDADFRRAIAVLSGRAGYDLVVKCLRLGLPCIVSVSAPSALAFDLCEAAGATLLGFARGEHFEVYCGGSRLGADPAASA
jgi:FdhD protein